MRNQQGISLVVTLVILMVVSILGLTVTQNSTMQYKMSSHAQQQGLVYQSARSELEAQLDQLSGDITDIQTLISSPNIVKTLVAQVSYDDQPIVSEVTLRYTGMVKPVGFDLSEFQGHGIEIGTQTQLRIRSASSAEDAEATSTQSQGMLYVMRTGSAQ